MRVQDTPQKLRGQEKEVAEMGIGDINFTWEGLGAFYGRKTSEVEF